ncbi:MAG: ABC transporter permease subunit [Treponemataceae bacterium]
MSLRKNRFKPYALIIPGTLFILFIVCTGLGVGLLQSLGVFRTIGMTRLTTEYYKSVFSSHNFLQSLYFSFYTSLCASLIAVLIGVALSVIFLNLKQRGKKAARIFRIPVSVPHLVVIVMMITLFAKTGFLSRFFVLLFPTFNTDFFSRFIFDKKGVGIILVYLWKEIPFVALTTHSVLANLDSELGITAQNLGASYFQTLIHVLLPLAAPNIFSSFVIIFAYSFGGYEVPQLIGATVPKALPVQAFIEYTNPLLENRPYAMAYSMLNLVFCLSLLLLFYAMYKILFCKVNIK